MKNVGCTNHCRTCGSHFSSVDAFDLHRQFEEGHKDDWDHRICEPPEDLKDRHGQPRLSPRTEHGFCAISVAGQRLEGVTVWSRPLEPGAADRLKSLRSGS